MFKIRCSNISFYLVQFIPEERALQRTRSWVKEANRKKLDTTDKSHKNGQSATAETHEATSFAPLLKPATSYCCCSTSVIKHQKIRGESFDIQFVEWGSF
jgi:hypothetical protein